MGEQVQRIGDPVSQPPEAAASADLMALLEERVLGLVHRHREARRTIQDLRTQLREREKRIGELNEKVYALGRLKQEVGKRVDRLIGEISEIERKHASTAASE